MAVVASAVAGVQVGLAISPAVAAEASAVPPVPVTQPSGTVSSAPVAALAADEAKATPADLTPAPTTTTSSPPPLRVDRPEQLGRVLSTLTPAQKGQLALQLIPWDWSSRLTGWRIDFEPARAGLLGNTNYQGRVITIYVRTTHRPEVLAETIAHELGHALDAEFLGPADDGATPGRVRWLELRGRSGAGWWPSCYCDDRTTGAGDLAESFAAHLLPGYPFESRLAGPPDAAARAFLDQLAGVS